MRIKKTCFSTTISDLWGRDGYQSHINVGDEFWYYFDKDSDVFRETGKHWNKLKITYLRSGCLFYDIPDSPDIAEQFCPVSCFMTSCFILATLDPIKDLSDLITNISTEAAKLMYCFNDEHTMVVNWANEKEVEVDEKEVFEKFGNTTDYLLIKAREVNDELKQINYEYN